MSFQYSPITYLYGAERDLAIRSLKQYFVSFTGAYFERLADTANPNRITEKDIVAVSMLGVQIPAEAAVWVLGEGADRISELLTDIPYTSDDDTICDQTVSLGRGSASYELYYLLRELRDVGRTKATKLMAAKRPALIPVYDSVVGSALGIGPDDDDWARWRAVLADENVRSEVRHVRDEVPAASGLSLLRTMDIVVWMRERGWSTVDGADLPPSPVTTRAGQA